MMCLIRGLVIDLNRRYMHLSYTEYKPTVNFLCSWKNPRNGRIYKVRVAFQVRIEPGKYDVSRHTVGISGDIDPLFPNSQLEWSTKRRGVSMLVGLLVKIERGMKDVDVGTLKQIMETEAIDAQGDWGSL